MSHTTDPIPETVMNERCADCATRHGTEANLAPITQHLFKLCVLTGSAFECHGAQGSGHLCRGFVDAFAAKIQSGDYERLPDWKRQVYLNLIDLIEDYTEADKRGKVASFDVEAAIRRVAEVAAPAAAAEAAQGRGTHG